ncbi:MAG: ACP S-malonyltransferase [Planctomycetes bacterium]|nr:ACP S-malonyltransferase [Planctomycetota bacterium]
MRAIALLFPGQGAQFVGMGKDVCDAYPEARAVFERADAALAGDLELSRICFEGPPERVNATDVCQPGILVTSLAILAVLERRRGFTRDRAALAAGLSLGEYTAHVFAGSLGFEDAVRLVRKRGQFMLDASLRQPSGMLSLLGAERAAAEAIAAEAASAGVIAVANLNAPGQIVLSGALGALDAAERIAPAHGIRKCRRLVVSGAFHSPLMEPAAEKLARELAGVTFQPPALPIVSNVTAQPVVNPREFPGLLARQVISPVRWEDSVHTMRAMGANLFVEPGPGKVLTGLLRKIDPDASSLAASTLDEVGAFPSNLD